MIKENHQLNLGDITPVADLQFEHLDKKYRSAHIIGTALIYFLLLTAALLLLLIDTPWPCVIAECVITVALIVNLLLLPKAYERKGYSCREHDITYRSGIIFPKVTTVPFIRIQQVSLKQNPVSKLFKLYSVEVVNGAQTLSSITVPGLTEMTATRIKKLITDKLTTEND